MKVENKRVIITGSANGIGSSLARAFSERNVQSMILVDLDESNNSTLAKKVGGTAYKADVGNEDEIINLKNIEDSFASAANYLNKIGWDNKTPCFYKVELINETPHKYLNTSAKQIKHKNKVSYLKKYIKNNNW